MAALDPTALTFAGSALGLGAAGVGVLSVGFWRQGRSLRDLWVKFGAWCWIVPMLALPIAAGPRVFAVLCAGLAQVAFGEFARATGLAADRPFTRFLRAMLALAYVPLVLGFPLWTGTTLAAAVGAVVCWPVLTGAPADSTRTRGLGVLALAWLGWFPSYLAQVRYLPDGVAWVLLLLTLVVVNDASAYLLGTLFGRRRLAPTLSPGKTVEGALGAAACTLLVAFGVGSALLPAVPTWWWPLLALPLAAAGTAGDLAMSALKRDCGIKDLGACIAGHGGVLDRLDSVLLAAPCFYYGLRLLGALA